MPDPSATTSEKQPGGIDLPPLSEATLDDETFEQLFTDIETLGEVLEIALKGAPSSRAKGAAIDLRAAQTQLKSGAARGLQIRYRFEGIEWWDTLFATPGGFRLVRIGHDWSESK